MNPHRLFLWLILASLQCGSFLSAAERPNIVFLLADDFGYGDLGCYGHPYARTPNLDRLALQGTAFRHFYSTGVTCCPARTGLMTSRFPATFATYPANGGFGDRVTITELLKRAGYATGHFGKWHIGPEPKPGMYGIDVIGAGTGSRRNANGGGRDSHIYDAAIQFIEQHREGPFYVNVWGHISHFPVNPAQDYVDKFKGLVVDEAKFAEPMREKFAECKNLGGDISIHMLRYLADVYSMDEDVGRLLKRIDELGLTNNTIVVFSSDQGPADLRFADPDAAVKKKKKRNKGNAGNDTTEIRLNAMGHTSGLRGGKHGMYEGGVRVPFIVRWPGHIPSGRIDEKSVISGIDWLPTLCAIAGVKCDAELDGEDVSKSWLGGEHVRTKPLFWKTSSPGSDAGIRFAQWKLIHPTRRRGDVELYDLSNDDAEKHNVAEQQTEIVKSLTAKVEVWTATLPKEYLKQQDTEN